MRNYETSWWPKQKSSVMRRHPQYQTTAWPFYPTFLRGEMILEDSFTLIAGCSCRCRVSVSWVFGVLVVCLGVLDVCVVCFVILNLHWVVLRIEPFTVEPLFMDHWPNLLRHLLISCLIFTDLSMKEGICHHDNSVNYIRMDQQTYMDRSQCLYSLQLNGVIFYLSMAMLVGPFHVTAS